MIIRKYRNADRTEVMKIGADTAFFGSPVETFFDDRYLFLESFYAYYFDRVSGTCWVAEENGRVIGFLAGSIKPSQQILWSIAHVFPGILINLIKGKYSLGKKSLGYIKLLLGQVLRRELVKADLSIYPANLHINVVAEARGLGVGKALMLAYHDQLRTLKINGVHLHTTDQNQAACLLYEKLGYTILDRKMTRAWMPLTGRIVENRCYGIRLLKSDH